MKIPMGSGQVQIGKKVFITSGRRVGSYRDLTEEFLTKLEKVARINGVFITDMSSIADFPLYQNQLDRLSKELGVKVERHDDVTAVLRRMRKRREGGTK